MTKILDRLQELSLYKLQAIEKAAGKKERELDAQSRATGNRSLMHKAIKHQVYGKERAQEMIKKRTGTYFPSTLTKIKDKLWGVRMKEAHDLYTLANKAVDHKYDSGTSRLYSWRFKDAADRLPWKDKKKGEYETAAKYWMHKAKRHDQAKAAADRLLKKQSKTVRENRIIQRLDELTGKGQLPKIIKSIRGHEKALGQEFKDKGYYATGMDKASNPKDAKRIVGTQYGLHLALDRAKTLRKSQNEKNKGNFRNAHNALKHAAWKRSWHNRQHALWSYRTKHDIKPKLRKNDGDE